MYASKIDLADNTRRASIAILQAQLADAVDLGTQAKQAHWNVKGPNFIALHELFDSVATEVADYSDIIAERIATLGGQAEGTVAVVAERSRLPAYAIDLAEGRAHVDALSRALASFGKTARAAIDTTAEAGDQ